MDDRSGFQQGQQGQQQQQQQQGQQPQHPPHQPPPPQYQQPAQQHYQYQQPHPPPHHQQPLFIQSNAHGQVVNQYRSACVECQRRKQRCSRVWPCNHCLKRKIADQCRFTNPPLDRPLIAPPEAQRSKRPLPDEQQPGGASADEDDGDLGFEALGYMAGPLLSSLGLDLSKSKQPEDLDWVNVSTCPQLQYALKILPARAQMDALLQSFFDNVNFHYYIIYPPVFLREYQTWWERITKHQPVTLQWTSLLIVVCACATQHLDVSLRPTFQLDLGEDVEVLSDKYHKLGRELANTIPVGHYHLLNVQRMLHSIYWYKAEARFVEAWHDISRAVREGQELGLHRESESDSLTEFDREMRRRVWCILDTWDWQFASGLCRPTIIDHTDVNVQQPNLTLEDLSPSPLLHMKLQSEVISILAARFGAPKNIVTLDEIQEYKLMLQRWMRTFPRVYDTENPDKSMDQTHPWIIHHRFYLHTMAYLMVLNPMRTYMAKPYTRGSPEAELQLRADGVYYSLKNMETTSAWVDHVSHKDGRFHFIIFSLFDTAAVLCTAIIKDLDHTIPRREEILATIDSSVVLLARLNEMSKTAKTSYEILSRLARRVPRPSNPPPKRTRVGELGHAGTEHRYAMNPGYQAASPDSSHYHEIKSEGTSPSACAASASSVTSASTPMSSRLDSEGIASPGASDGASPNVDYQSADSRSPILTGNTTVRPQAGAPPPAGVTYLQPGTYIDASQGLMHPGVMPPQVLPPQGVVAPTGLAPGSVGGFVQPLHPPLVYAHPAVYAQPMPPPPPAPQQQPQPQAAAPPPAPMPEPALQEYGFENLTDAQLGEFAQLWNWQSLNLDFISSESVGPPPPTM